MARPTKFKPEMVETMTQYKHARATKTACAKMLGITIQTWCNWVQRYPEFANAQSDWYRPWQWRRNPS